MGDLRAPKRAEEPLFGNDQTRLEATTPEMPLANPLDKTYLCGKCCPALQNPLQNRLGYPMYQRTVTRSIWGDNRLAKQYWRYKGEVGYDMTKNPPLPIMSGKKGEENRPSTFPLSALQGINKAAQAAAEDASAAAGDPLTRKELEKAGGKRLRIPDVIVLNCPPELLDEMKAGTADIGHFIPVQKNIERIVEVKFNNDSLSEDQDRAYRVIAGNAEFNLLEPENPEPELGCKCREKRRQSQTKPVPNKVLIPEPMSRRQAAPLQVQPMLPPYPSNLRPLGETLPSTSPSHVSGWAVVLVGLIVVVAIAGAPETGGTSLLLLTAP